MKRFALVIPLLAFCFNIAAETTLNVGTYNIKSYSVESIWQHLWANRKSYVVQTITDNDYDVIGVNEIREIGSQRSDMNSLMSKAGYSLVEYSDGGANACYNTIYFKDSRFVLLDKGQYFLTADGTRKESWNATSGLIRFTTWAKLRVIATDEIFYFFSTHLDYTSEIGVLEQARINVEHVRAIAGAYPVVLAGDHNMSSGYLPYYGYTQSYMKDCAVAAEQKVNTTYAATMGKITVDGTEVWSPDCTNTIPIDFIWAGRMAAISKYEIIKTGYEKLKGECPSDHYAVQASITLAPVKDNTLHASATEYTLREALALASTGDTIFVKDGSITLSSPLEINKSVTIVGGCDASFKPTADKTIINGLSSVSHLITIAKNCAVELVGLELCGGKAVEGNGGAVFCEGSSLTLTDCYIHDNYAIGNGAGVYATGQLVARNSRFDNNIAQGDGGAVCVPETTTRIFWRQTIDRCSFTNNTARNGSAAFIGAFSMTTVSGCSFLRNKALISAALYLKRIYRYNHSTVVNNTFNGNSGTTASVLHVNQTAESSFLSTTSVVNNTIAHNDGAEAILFEQTDNAYLYNNIIVDNGMDVNSAATNLKSVNNVFSHMGSINFSASLSDLLSPSVAEAESAIEVMLGRTDVNGTIPVLNAYFGEGSINDIAPQMLMENTFYGDVDNNADFGQSLCSDQLGCSRRTDGTASRGALEAGVSEQWNGDISEPKTITKGLYAGWYQITKPSELAWVSEQAKEMTFNGNLYVASNIDLSKRPWQPIAAFCGKIEGNGLNIVGLNIEQATNENIGLIGIIDGEDCSISHLNVEGVISASSNARNIGGIVGKAVNTKMQGSSFAGSIISSASSGDAIIGGLAGDIYSSEIGACWICGDITATQPLQAIAGIVGTADENSSVHDCYINAAIEGKNACHVESIIGITSGNNLTNNYYQDSFGHTSTQAHSYSIEELHGGALARRLNNGQPDGAFGQILNDKNSIPVTRNDRNTVYKTEFYIDGSITELRYNNTNISFPSDPVKAGYIFLGWFDAEEGGNNVGHSTITHGDMTLYAQFEEIEKWDGITTTQPQRIEDETSQFFGYYNIRKPSELAWIAKQTQAVLVSDNVYIANDIDLNDKPWTPIGLAHSFNGRIEGADHTIHNLRLQAPASGSFYGFIGQTNNAEAAICNLSLNGVFIISNDNTSLNAGTIVGKANAMKEMVNCHSNVTINVCNGGSASYLGGLIGLAKNTNVSECSYSGNITIDATSTVTKGWGGLVGTFNSTVSGHVGALEYSWFDGEIYSFSTTASSYGAALCGYPNLSGGTCYIRNNYAYGVMQTTNKPKYSGSIYGRGGTGMVARNNYNVAISTDVRDGVKRVEKDVLRSGELCYLLNGDQSSIIFGQDLDEDASQPLLARDGHKQVVKVRFVVDDADYLCTYYNKGNILTLPENPSKERYDFVGWSLSSDNQTILSTDYEVEDDIILYAVFQPNDGIDATTITSSYQTATYNLLGQRIDRQHSSNAHILIKKGRKIFNN